MRRALILLVLASCTPEQRPPAKTALEVSQCIIGIAQRHLDRAERFDDPRTLAAIAAELAIECNPHVPSVPQGG